ncbi:MAG: hypothetical protein JW969_13190, partial [Spirochaetales bacterium]|nr:hypothetical protein [Spirochaetales bacterium]
LLKDIPIHWNLVSNPFLENPSRLEGLIDDIQSRVESKKDIPLPMGYTGALHPYLTLLELEKEVFWSKKNPWNSGIEDKFSINPRALLPYFADLKRKESIEIYKKYGFKIIGIESSHYGSLPHNTMDDLELDDIRFFSMYKLDLNNLEKARLFPKVLNLKNSEYLFILIDISKTRDNYASLSKTVWEPLQSFIHWLNSRYKMQFPDVHEHDFQKNLRLSKQVSNNGSFSFPNNPVSNLKVLNTENFRRLRFKTMMDYKKILGNLSYKDINMVEDSKPNAFKDSVFPDPVRETTASMQGIASIMQDNFTVNFDEGKLKNFLLDGKPQLSGLSTRSYIQIEGKKINFKNLSSSSIEGEKVRGLREVQNIFVGESESAGLQVTDYFFTEDIPYLFLTTKIELKALNLENEIEAFVPFEMPFFTFTKREKIVVQAFHENTPISYIFDHQTKKTCIPGNLFYISKDDHVIILGFPQENGLDFGLIEIKIEKVKRNYIFNVIILGSAFPNNARLFQGYSEISSVFLGCSSIFPGEAPEMALNVAGEIPVHQIYKNSL